MVKPPLPANEDDRLAALRGLAILDTPSEERFDRVTRLAQRMFDVPIAVVSLIDVNRQWFKSCQGLDATETPRDISFCGHAILEADTFVIEDALKDERFADNPLVTGEPKVRFYAGHPLRLADGHVIGTLCLIGREPRRFGPEDRASLRDMAAIVLGELSAVELAGARSALERQTQLTELMQAVAVAANGATTLEEGTRVCLDRICNLSRWPIGHLWLRNVDDPDTLVPSGIWHLDDPDHFAPFRALSESMTLTPGSGLAGRVLERGEPVWFVHDPQAPLPAEAEGYVRRDLATRLGILSGIAFPVLIGTEVVGVMEFFSTRPAAPDADWMSVMAHACAQLGRVVERERASQALQHAKDEAERASRAKSMFLANMSHELRTPLNAILGYSEMLSEEAEETGQDAFVPDLNRINAAGKHLLQLINDILDLSKIEAGKMDLYLEEFSADELLAEVASTVQPLIARRGNQLVVAIAPGLPMLKADLTKVRQTLFNLLSNAAKFTEHGTIRLSVEQTGDHVAFGVADTGIGMSAAQLQGLFEEFSQADASTTRKYGGTGLGLSISRRFAEMMGGALTVTSEPDRGSTFTLTMPARLEEATELTSSMAGTFGRPAKTVLAIDDDPVMLDLMERFLLKEGFHVMTAPSGKEGLRLAREFHPDAITLDVMMPGMDGWSVLAALKADEAIADVPVVMLTMVDDRSMGFALGVAEYMVKPLDRTRLAAALHGLLNHGGGTVLVVDDEPDMRGLLRRMLEKEGYRVAEAGNGREALACLPSVRPALILLDMAMPKMDGLAFLEALQHDAEHRDVPVIVLTASEPGPEERDRLHVAVEAVLKKSSLSRDALLSQVKRYLDASVRPAVPEGTSHA